MCQQRYYDFMHLKYKLRLTLRIVNVFYVYIHHVVPNTDLISFLDTLLVTFVLLITKSCDLWCFW